jgi:hypothetical protein
VTIGNEHRTGLTACNNGGIHIKFNHINFCQVGGYPSNRISGGDIPKKDRSVTARGGEFSIIVCAENAKKKKRMKCTPLGDPNRDETYIEIERTS